ncbi:MAG TPA: hypothetical protein VLK66_00225 [Longimicrobium sp.]|nr:hypothetical protein [Longimicrobium sp.]
MQEETMDRVKRSGRLLLGAAAVLACVLAAGPAEALDSPPGGAQACTPTIPADTFISTRGGQGWQRVADYMKAAGANFDLGVMDTQPVKLCNTSGDPSCLPKVLQIRSEHLAMCLDAAAFNGQLRIVGMVVGQGPGSLPAYGFGPANISGGGSNRDSVYLFVRNDSVFALFRTTGDVTAFAPQPGLVTPGWAFFFHAPDTPPAGTWALWRADTTLASYSGAYSPVRALRRGGPAAPDAGGEAAAGAVQTTLSYGWMACAAGCCQFHGTGDGGDQEHGPRGPRGHHPSPNPNPNPNPHPNPARRR